MNSGGRGEYQRGFIRRNTATTPPPQQIEGKREYHDICVAPTQENRACNSPEFTGLLYQRLFFLSRCLPVGSKTVTSTHYHRCKEQKIAVRQQRQIYAEAHTTGIYPTSSSCERSTFMKNAANKWEQYTGGQQQGNAHRWRDDDDVLALTPLRPFLPSALKKHPSMRGQTRAPSMGKVWVVESEPTKRVQYATCIPGTSICVDALRVILQ